MFKVLITTYRLFPEGGSLHTVITEFEWEEQADKAIIELNKRSMSNSDGTVWGVRHEAVKL